MNVHDGNINTCILINYVVVFFPISFMVFLASYIRWNKINYYQVKPLFSYKCCCINAMIMLHLNSTCVCGLYAMCSHWRARPGSTRV